MGTTLYCDPLMGTLDINRTLGGMFVHPTLNNQKVIWVEWPNGGRGKGSIIPSSAASGICVANLWVAVQENIGTATAADPLRIVGHSGGAQNIMRFIREKSAALQSLLTSLGKPINCIVFYCLGCPEQKFTGASYLYPVQSPAAYPGDGTKCGLNGGPHDANCPSLYPSQHGGYGIGYGLPLTCPFTVHVVSMQYDGWSMAPTNPAHPQLNKFYDILAFVIPRKVWDHSLICAMKASNGPHGEYHAKDSKNLSHADAFSYTDPAQTTVKYWYIRRYPFPGFDKSRTIRFIARSLDMKNRASIDTAFAATDSTHGMQISIPAPDYSAVASWFPLS
jgi:hypothetical protein